LKSWYIEEIEESGKICFFVSLASLIYSAPYPLGMFHALAPMVERQWTWCWSWQAEGTCILTGGSDRVWCLLFHTHTHTSAQVSILLEVSEGKSTYESTDM